MTLSMYCDICRQPAEIIIYDTTAASSVPQRVKGVYCHNHSPYKMKIVWCGRGGELLVTPTPQTGTLNYGATGTSFFGGIIQSDEK